MGLSSGGHSGQGVGLSSKSVKVVCDCNVDKGQEGWSEESRTIPPGWRGNVRRALSPDAKLALHKVCVPLGAGGLKRHNRVVQGIEFQCIAESAGNGGLVALPFEAGAQ